MNKILDAYKPMWSLNHAISLMGWDFETYMPRKGTEERGVADSQLRMMHKDLLLNKDFVGLVESAKKLGSLSDLEKGIIRVLNREITKQIKIPKELTEAEKQEWMDSVLNSNMSVAMIPVIFYDYLKLADYETYLEKSMNAWLYFSGWESI